MPRLGWRWCRHDRRRPRPGAGVGRPVRHRQFRRRVEHRRVDRSDLRVVYYEPFTEGVSWRRRARPSYEHRIGHHDLRLLIHQRSPACDDHRQVEVLQSADAVVAARAWLGRPAAPRRRSRCRGCTLACWCARTGRGRTSAAGSLTAGSRRKKRSSRCGAAVLHAPATLMCERDRAVVGRDGVEVAIHDPDQRVAIGSLVARHGRVAWRVRREVIGIVQVGRWAALAAWPSQPRVVGAREEPFGFGELAVLDAHADRNDRRLAPLFDRAEIAGLSGDRVEVPPLHLAKAGHRLPHAVARAHVDRILGLAESDDERGGSRIVLDDGSKILIEHGPQTRPIARLCRGRRCHADRHHHTDDPLE